MSQANKTTASVVTEFFIVGFPGLQPKYYSLIGALLFIIYIAVITRNSLIVVLFVIERSLHKLMYIIMLSLSLSDIGFCTVALPKVISRYWFNDGNIGFHVCLFQRQLIHYFGTLNSLIMMIMALDRYLAICYPLRHPVLMTNRTMRRLIGFSWVTAMIASTISLMQTVKLPFCGPNMIAHCFCDGTSINQLACADATLTNLNAYVVAMFVLFYLCHTAIITIYYVPRFVVTPLLTYQADLLTAVHLSIWDVRSGASGSKKSDSSLSNGVSTLTGLVKSQ